MSHLRVGRLSSPLPPLFLCSLSMLALSLSVQDPWLTLSFLRLVENGKEQSEYAVSILKKKKIKAHLQNVSYSGHSLNFYSKYVCIIS